MTRIQRKKEGTKMEDMNCRKTYVSPTLTVVGMSAEDILYNSLLEENPSEGELIK